jgi:hypothetical protein
MVRWRCDNWWTYVWEERGPFQELWTESFLDLRCPRWSSLCRSCPASWFDLFRSFLAVTCSDSNERGKLWLVWGLVLEMNDKRFQIRLSVVTAVMAYCVSVEVKIVHIVIQDLWCIVVSPFTNVFDYETFQVYHLFFYLDIDITIHRDNNSYLARVNLAFWRMRNISLISFRKVFKPNSCRQAIVCQVLMVNYRFDCKYPLLDLTLHYISDWRRLYLMQDHCDCLAIFNRPHCNPLGKLVFTD